MASEAAAIDAFITRWQVSGGAERANCQSFLSELCDLLDLPRPAPATGATGDYRYERPVTRNELDDTTSKRFIDLYRRGAFVLEAKQGQDASAQQTSLFPAAATETARRASVRSSPGWVQAMLKAKGQAERYARDVPADEGWPPFVMVCDVGFCIDIYADFSGTWKHYAQFPSRDGYRWYLTDLRDPAYRDRLRAIWLDPLSFDPSKQRVAVTREIAALLKAEPDQFVRLRASLRNGPVTVREIAKGIKGAAANARMSRMLETLVALGQARAVEGGRFSL